MIEIKCVDRDRLRTVYAVTDENSRVYEMCDKDDVIGTAAVVLEGERLTVKRCDAPDPFLMDALFRATLNAELKEGAREACSDDPSVVFFAAKKGYSDDFSQTAINIKDFFSNFVCKG